MKHDPSQLPLFPKRGALPSQPFTLEASPVFIELCVKCGKQQFSRHRTADGRVATRRVGDHSDCREEL